MSKAKGTSQLRFPSREALCSWLCQTDEGREVLKEVTKPRRRARVPVLIVLHSDGWVEAFSLRKQADVRIVPRLHVTEPTVAVDVDLYTDLLAGRNHARIHWPNHLVATGQVERITPAQEHDRLIDMRLLRAIREINA